MIRVRTVRRAVVPILALFFVALVVGVPDVSAGRTWCRTDPVIKVDGQVADIWVSSYTEMNTSATGPVKIVVPIPTGSTGAVYAMDNGFGQGYQISFVKSSSMQRTATHTQVRVQVYAPAKDSTLPVQVDMMPRSQNGNTGVLLGASASGTANKWVSLTTK